MLNRTQEIINANAKSNLAKHATMIKSDHNQARINATIIFYLTMKWESSVAKFDRGTRGWKHVIRTTDQLQRDSYC